MACRTGRASLRRSQKRESHHRTAIQTGRHRPPAQNHPARHSPLGTGAACWASRFGSWLRGWLGRAAPRGGRPVHTQTQTTYHTRALARTGSLEHRRSVGRPQRRRQRASRRTLTFSLTSALDSSATSKPMFLSSHSAKLASVGAALPTNWGGKKRAISPPCWQTGTTKAVSSRVARAVSWDSTNWCLCLRCLGLFFSF